MVEQRRRVDTPMGPIDYTLTVKNVKNMNLRLRPDGGVAVSVSRRVSRGEADAFVRAHADWIARRRARLADRPEPLEVPDRETALPLLLASLDRMWPLVAGLGVNKPALKGRKMVSRWGSCHVNKGLIVMNTALAGVPQDLRDYVTLHELVHFLHPNHGPGFYGVMDALMPDWREKRKRLRGYALEK